MNVHIPDEKRKMRWKSFIPILLKCEILEWQVKLSIVLHNIWQKENPSKRAVRFIWIYPTHEDRISRKTHMFCWMKFMFFNFSLFIFLPHCKFDELNFCLNLSWIIHSSTMRNIWEIIETFHFRWKNLWIAGRRETENT